MVCEVPSTFMTTSALHRSFIDKFILNLSFFPTHTMNTFSHFASLALTSDWYRKMSNNFSFFNYVDSSLNIKAQAS